MYNKALSLHVQSMIQHTKKQYEHQMSVDTVISVLLNLKISKSKDQASLKIGSFLR